MCDKINYHTILRKLLLDEKLRKKIGKSEIEHVKENYSIKSVSNDFLSICTKLTK